MLHAFADCKSIYHKLAYAGKLAAFLSSSLVKDLLNLSENDLHSDLILDAYK